MTVKADAGATGGAVSVLEAEEPPGFGPPIHVHQDAAEAFYVLEGEYVMYLEDREVVCPAGSFIFIPRGARHGFKVGDVPSRKLNFYFPAAMIGYFDDLAAAVRRDELDDAGLAEIARRTRWKSSGRRQNATSRRVSQLPDRCCGSGGRRCRGHSDASSRAAARSSARMHPSPRRPRRLRIGS